MVTIPKRYFTVVTAYVHVFVAYLKFVNREFLWDLSSLLLILRLMHFWFSCENIVACCWEYLLHSVKNSCEFADFLRHKTLNACEELLSFDVVSLFTKIPLDLAAKVAEERLRIGASLGQKLLCCWGISFICCLFASKPRNLHTTAPTINGNGRRETKGPWPLHQLNPFSGKICRWCYFCGIRKWIRVPPIAFEFNRAVYSIYPWAWKR